MQLRGCLSLIVGSLLLTQCRKPAEVVITETRELTTSDHAPKLRATSDERFRNVQPSPVSGEAPTHWRALPTTQFRLLNYRFGASGTGEVWVSLSSGTVLENINRWLAQFGKAPIDATQLEKLTEVAIAGRPGTWVTAEGTYAGMGGAAQTDSALAGVVVEINGQILTVKMVGPKDEVAAAHADLKVFSESLKLLETAR